MPLFTVKPALVVPGQALITRHVYVYQCPLCKKQFRYDDPFEPMCTGPSESRDEHGPEVMRLLRKEPIKVVVRLGR